MDIHQGAMMPIRLTKYAQEQCIERGTNEAEISDAIGTGNRKAAKKGRFLYQSNFQYNAEWQGKFYAIKLCYQASCACGC